MFEGADGRKTARGKGGRAMFLMVPGRVAIVTGAAQGIGYATAARLARAGARVVVADIQAANAANAAARITAAGGDARAVHVDVTQPDSVAAMVAQATELFGPVEILVNNAGALGRTAPLWEQTDADWANTLALNLTGVFLCCRAVIAGMRAGNYGRIVSIASVAGKEGNVNAIPYSVAKAGVIPLTKSLAKEVLETEIRVNCVAPGMTDTAFVAAMTPEAREWSRQRIPLGRLGRPEEIAAVVHFLASDDASFVTGQCYDVSGGRATY